MGVSKAMDVQDRRNMGWNPAGSTALSRLLAANGSVCGLLVGGLGFRVHTFSSSDAWVICASGSWGRCSALPSVSPILPSQRGPGPWRFQRNC
jgi:hypothetical protein